MSQSTARTSVFAIHSDGSPNDVANIFTPATNCLVKMLRGAKSFDIFMFIWFRGNHELSKKATSISSLGHVNLKKFLLCRSRVSRVSLLANSQLYAKWIFLALCICWRSKITKFIQIGKLTQGSFPVMHCNTLIHWERVEIVQLSNFPTSLDSRFMWVAKCFR